MHPSTRFSAAVARRHMLDVHGEDRDRRHAEDCECAGCEEWNREYWRRVDERVRRQKARREHQTAAREE